MLAERLARLGVRARRSAVVLPLRYEDRTRIVPIGALLAGSRAVVEGEVLLAEVAFRRRRQLLVRLGDGSGSLTLRFFHFSMRSGRPSVARGFAATARCAAAARSGDGASEYRGIGAAGEALSQTLTPIYPAPKD
jgi:ATP-dependent DNA helicase RecG